MRVITIAGILLVLMTAGCARRRVAGPPPPPDSGSIEANAMLTRYFEAIRGNALRDVSMTAHFDGRLIDMKKEARIDARRIVSAKGEIDYEVQKQEGDASVRKNLIARFMSGEVENALKDNSGVAINTLNYRIKYKGARTVEGRSVHVFELNPREKAEGLFKGELWLDDETALPLQESGRLVKSPSVFLKDVQFTRRYEIRDGLAIPVLIQTSTKVRVYGVAELDVRYTDITWRQAPAAPARR